MSLIIRPENSADINAIYEVNRHLSRREKQNWSTYLEKARHLFRNYR